MKSLAIISVFAAVIWFGVEVHPLWLVLGVVVYVNWLCLKGRK